MPIIMVQNWYVTKKGKITLLTGDGELEFGYIDVKSGKYKMIVSVDKDLIIAG